MISKGSVSTALAISSRVASIKGFGGLTGSFPKLLVVTWPLNKVQQLLGEVGIWEGRGVTLRLTSASVLAAVLQPRCHSRSGNPYF